MNGDSFIKIYIKHIQNICKGKIAPVQPLKSGSLGRTQSIKMGNRNGVTGKPPHMQLRENTDQDKLKQRTGHYRYAA